MKLKYNFIWPRVRLHVQTVLNDDAEEYVRYFAFISATISENCVYLCDWYTLASEKLQKIE